MEAFSHLFTGGWNTASLLVPLALFFGGCALVTLVLWAVSEESGRPWAADSGHSAFAHSPVNVEALVSAKRPAKMKGMRVTGPEFYPGFIYAEPGAARLVFEAEIQRGDARYDHGYGVVYNIRPAETDDWTQITGLDQAAAERLNSMGCFTYKQMAFWSLETCRRIASEWECEDRLFLENWPAQSRSLHLAKYGQQLPGAA